MEIKIISFKPYPKFVVSEGIKILIQIKLDTEMNGFRIRCQNSRRVFFITEESIKNKTLITLSNEYSQKIGSISKSPQEKNSGRVEIEGFEYNYKIDSFSEELYLYKNVQPFQFHATYKLGLKEWPFPGEIYINYILFSVAWFLFSTNEKTFTSLAPLQSVF
ncbi:MAG: hypothetical protein ABI091_14215 [Ferruginibacter sp.]